MSLPVFIFLNLFLAIFYHLLTKKKREKKTTKVGGFDGFAFLAIKLFTLQSFKTKFYLFI
jgi:hypothetical protein